ncbi:MAG: Cas10/Cmr2 second palm domain-containing protein, partial [Gammaproteobacteria bacterium]
TDTGTDFDEGGTSKKVREWVDRASHMKSAGRFRKSRNLSDRFGASEGMRWPTLLDPEDADKGTGSRNLGDPFPFLPDNRYVGILHADGNDLGLLLEELRERSNADNQDSYKDLFRAFSQAMSEATQAAAQDASAILIAAVADEDRPNFQGIYPARPLILGGDDLTIIVRADCALDYAEQFIQAFNQHTQVAFQGLRSGPHGETFSFLPESGMSACAGIAFIKSTQPFYLAYDLAEGLCDHAKKSSRDQSGTKHSALAFARVTTSFIPRYQDLLDDELSIRDASDALYRTTLGAYAVGLPADIDLPPLSALRELKDLLARPDMSRGPARQLLSLLHYSPNEAERTYQRWQDNLKDADRDRHQKRWQKFSAALQALGINPEASLPYRSRQGHIPDTPLGDALAWLAVDGSTEANDHD